MNALASRRNAAKAAGLPMLHARPWEFPLNHKTRTARRREYPRTGR